MQNIDLSQALIDTWRTNNRVTVYLFENLPEEVWPEKVPGAPRRTVRMIAGHIHNCRCMWVKTLGRKHDRGQIVMLARQLGHRLPGEVTAGLWQWSKRSKET
ncbi:MAG: hypothetical protein P8Y07_09900 [Gemmatimonadales bacterium]